MATLRGGLLLYKETATGFINNINTIFTSTYRFIPGTIIVYLNGLEQTLSEDYVELSTNTIQFLNPPSGGIDPDIVLFQYQKA